MPRKPRRGVSATCGRSADNLRRSFPKTVCPISREQFVANAKPLEVVINGVPMTAEAKEFSSGSLGWNISDKITVEIGGKAVKCQVGLNVTLIASKDLPKDVSAAA